MTNTAHKTSPSAKQQANDDLYRDRVFAVERDVFQIKCLISTLHHLTHEEYLDQKISNAIYGVTVGLGDAHKRVCDRLYGEA